MQSALITCSWPVFVTPFPLQIFPFPFSSLSSSSFSLLPSFYLLYIFEKHDSYYFLSRVRWLPNHFYIGVAVLFFLTFDAFRECGWVLKDPSLGL